MPYLIAGSRRLYYSDRGRTGGTPLVFLHGAGGNRLLWGSQLRGLAQTRRVVALDWPGHGRSEGPAIPSVSDLADLAAQALVQVGAPAVVVGHSMGGGVALQLALQHPEVVAGLVLVGSGGRLRVAPAVLAGLQADFPGAVQAVTSMAYAPAAAAALRERGEAALMAAGQATLLADFRACDGFDVLTRLGEIRVPCLVLCGSEDRMTPPKYSAALVAGISGARLQAIPSVGHMAMLEAPASVTAALRDFMSGR